MNQYQAKKKTDKRLKSTRNTFHICFDSSSEILILNVCVLIIQEGTCCIQKLGQWEARSGILQIVYGPALTYCVSIWSRTQQKFLQRCDCVKIQVTEFCN
jgi:hypothetical protein